MTRRHFLLPALVLTAVVARPEAQPAWTVLFDGTSLAAFRGYRSDTVPDGWAVVDGTLAKAVATDELITREQYGDFELSFEWKTSPGGDGGVFYRGTEEEAKVYWTGPEYQVLDDDAAADNTSRLTCAGAAYGLYPSPPGHLRPVGEWNASRIVARGPRVEHWLNGEKLLEYEMWSPDWESKVAASKFAKWPKYGRAARGHIAFQGGHAEPLAYRNIRIRELTPP